MTLKGDAKIVDNEKKKSLLISWAAHMFTEVMEPVVRELKDDFRIVIILVDYYTPTGLINCLTSWRTAGVIENFFVIPNYNKTLSAHLFMKRNLAILSSYRFDVWLTGSEMQVNERYILGCILPRWCVKIILWHGITYLLEKNELAKMLLVNPKIEIDSVPRTARYAEKYSRFKFLKSKIKEAGSGIVILRKGLRLIYNSAVRLYRFSLRKFRYFFNRVLLPWMIVNRTFEFGPYDQLTQLGSGRSDAIIFCDEIEAQVHRTILEDTDIYTAQYPTQGSCRCDGGETGKNAILSPLSGFVGSDNISKKALEMYLRDFRIVMAETDASIVQLRPHPRETGKWPNQLRDYLISHEIDAIVTDCKRPIRKIMCDYLGMAGFPSQALRDARACCDYLFVIGSIALGKYRYSDPKFVFGNSEGIGWIEEDGTYDPDIFSRKKYVAPYRKSIPQTIIDLSITHKKSTTSSIPKSSGLYKSFSNRQER